MSQPNKLIIFDLDGVLIESRNLHYIALNQALFTVDPKFSISLDEHLSTFDGLNTTRKLAILTEQRGLDPKFYTQIWQEKQRATRSELLKLPSSRPLRLLFEMIQHRGYKIAVASNSIRETVKISLLGLGLIDLVDYWVSNEDVRRPKPHPEMYWQCMTQLNALPKHTIIIEDSHLGRCAAMDSGAELFAVENAAEVAGQEFYHRLEIKMTQIENQTRASVPWIDTELNVLIPMAGAGSRFAQAGYTFPKPLIEVNGKPMIQVVVENLNIHANYIFLVQREHFEKYNLKYLLNLIAPECQYVIVDQLTQGAASTTLLAKDLINNDHPLLIANSDQFIEWNSNECLYAFGADDIDGGILTFEATHPKWSYAKTGSNGFVEEVAEKRVISNRATVGIYYWRRGSDYVHYAEEMISKDIRTNNEFYVCPVFNQAIADGKRIRTKSVDRMWGIGTPEDLNYFLQHYQSK